MWGADEGLSEHTLLKWAEPYAGPQGLRHMEVKEPFQAEGWGGLLENVVVRLSSELGHSLPRVHYSFVLCADRSGRLLHYRGLPLRLAKAAPWPAVYDKPASSIRMADGHALRYWGTAGVPTRVSRAHLPQLFCLSFLFIPSSPHLVSP